MTIATKLNARPAPPLPVNKHVTLDEPMISITFGSYGAQFILPWGTGVKVMNLMREATAVKSEYTDGQVVWHKAAKVDLVLQSFEPEKVAQVLMSGD